MPNKGSQDESSCGLYVEYIIHSFFSPFLCFFFFYIYCIYLKNMSAEQADTTKKATGGEGMLPLCE